MNPAPEPRKSSTLRSLRTFLITILCVVTFIALFYAEEDFRGAAEWARTKKELEVKGETLEPDKSIPPLIPDDQNLASAPIFAELFSVPSHDLIDMNMIAKTRLGEFSALRWKNFRTGNFGMGRSADMQSLYSDFSGTIARVEDPAKEILHLLQPKSDLFNEVTQAAARPQTRWPIHYEEGIAASYPELGAEYLLAKAFTIRALAELDLGATNAGWQDCQVILRLSSTQETTEMGYQFEYYFHQQALGLIWEGMWRHSWSEDQLQAIQASLASHDPLNLLINGVRGDRAGIIRTFFDRGFSIASRKLWQAAFMGLGLTPGGWFTITYCPSGWFYLSLSHTCQRNQDLIEALRSVSAHQAPDLSQGINFKRKLLVYDPLSYLFYGRNFSGRQTADFQRAVMDVDYSHLAYVACQIERYRLANGHLPPTLEAMPELAGQPAALDVLTNQPFAYHLIGTDDYRLYSFGPNRKDDGGVYVDGSTGSQGDWVWYSSPQAAK